MLGGNATVLFALLPSWELANAAATLVGQNLGAGRPERAEQAVWTAARWNLYFLTGVGVMFVVLAGPIVAIFDPEPVARDIAVRALRIVVLGFPLYAYGMARDRGPGRRR